ncbi:hypothetical protein PG996_008828 [Apiospora saccharicola]|uniref:Uncharacterized protein n=1 Tax=Apiospora saccharicola TaxID=335842 RepID=A0ABR1V1L4_9PEZI
MPQTKPVSSEQSACQLWGQGLLTSLTSLYICHVNGITPHSALRKIRHENERNPAGGSRPVLPQRLTMATFHLNSVEAAASSSQRCSWEDVLASMEQAVTQDETKIRRNRARALLRNRPVIVTLQSLTNMIPDQDGLSVMRGGLKYIFDMLRQRVTNRERIIRAFEDMPLTFSKACDTFCNHPEDEALKEYVNDLYETLRLQVPRLVETLTRPKEGSYECTELVKRAARKVSDRVDVLVGKAMMTNLSETRLLGTKIDRVQTEVSRLYQSIQTIESGQVRAIQRLQIGHEDRPEHVKQLSTAIEDKIDAVTTQLRQEVAEFRGDIQRLLAIQAQTSLETSTPRKAKRSTPTYIPEIFQVTYDDVLYMIDFEDPMFLVNDLEEVLRKGRLMLPGALSRAAWVLTTERFAEWTNIEHNDVLLIDGYMAELVISKVSPLSCLASTLVSVARMQPHSLVLYHFCGLHSHPLDTPSGPRGLLHSFIAQLVVGFDHIEGENRVYPTIGAGLLVDIPHQDLPQLWSLFMELISQVPSGVIVYMVIDDAPEFETSLHEWEEEMKSIVDALVSLSAEGVVAAVLKVLVTCAQKCMDIRRFFRADDYISLEAGNLGDGLFQNLGRHDATY